MSISSIQSSINSARRDVGDLQKRVGEESKKEGALNQKLASLQGKLTGKLSASSLQSILRDIGRLQDDLSKVQTSKAGYQKKLADKTSQLHKYEVDLSKEQERERKRIEEAEKRREREQLAYQRQLTEQLQAQSREMQALRTLPPKSTSHEEPMKQFDLFISHASEDKEAFVRPLAQALSDLGLVVWFDEMQLKVGDSLRRSIDRGLANSKYGVVVLSSAFFAKNWPQYELDGMVAREMNGVKVVLPIWHKVSKDEVLSYSPTLADKLALNSSLLGINEIAQQLAEVVKS